MHIQELTSPPTPNIRAHQPDETTQALNHKVNRIAKAFSRAGVCLNAVFCGGKQAVQVLEDPERTPVQTSLPSEPEQTGIELVQAPAIQPPKAMRARRDHLTRSEILHRRLFDGHSLSRDEQRRMRREICRRSMALGEPEQNPFFTFNASELPGLTKNEEENFAFVTKPGHPAKLVIADLYEKKYGVKIFVQKDYVYSESMARLFLEKLENSHGAPVGLILQPPQVWQLQRGAQRPQEYDYRDHVAPVIIQRTTQGFDVINLDFLEDLNLPVFRALENLDMQGYQIRRMELRSAGRQADTNSCHTDALQILKDALVAHQRVGGNLFEHYWNEYGVHSQAPSSGDIWESVHPIDLPPHLQKTAQRSKAMVATRPNTEDSLRASLPSKNPWKNQTLGEHRQRYSFYPQNSDRPVNNFVVFKAYRNAFKVLDKLESFPNAAARQHYLQELKAKNQFD